MKQLSGFEKGSHFGCLLWVSSGLTEPNFVRPLCARSGSVFLATDFPQAREYWPARVIWHIIEGDASAPSGRRFRAVLVGRIICRGDA
jgi:hypothetical protein